MRYGFLGNSCSLIRLSSFSWYGVFNHRSRLPEHPYLLRRKSLIDSLIDCLIHPVSAALPAQLSGLFIY
jgi:hypothetical protein